MQVKVTVRMGDSKHNTIKMPAHIFGEISYTESGFRLLKEHNYIEYFVHLIRTEST